MDLRETLNAKQNQEGDLCTKLNDRIAATSSKVIVPIGSIFCMIGPELRKVVPRYKIPFSHDIEGMDSLKKFTPPRFALYDEKSDPRSNINQLR